MYFMLNDVMEMCDHARERDRPITDQLAALESTYRPWTDSHVPIHDRCTTAKLSTLHLRKSLSAAIKAMASSFLKTLTKISSFSIGKLHRARFCSLELVL